MMSPLKILLIDNYDSFTYNLYDYLLQLKTDCTVIRNDEIPFDQVHQLEFDAIVLSPGPKRPADAGFMMDLIDYYHDKVPILGICLGHQGLGEYFGASLQKAQQPVHGKTSIVQQQGHPLFKNLPAEYKVMRYHSLLLKDLDDSPLLSIAHTDEGENMAIAHPQYPLYGVQFHPESILTEHGLQLLHNWLRLVQRQLISFRDMRPEEAETVSELVLRIQEEFNNDTISPEGQAHLRNDIVAADKILERQQGADRVMVATFKDQILGMAEFRPPGHLKLLFVDGQAHGLGIGQHMIKEAVKWTRQNHPESSKLTVSSSPYALDFYLKYGFITTGDPDEIQGVPFIPMELPF